jgi:formate dehydrogenase subunit gamma
MSVILDDSNTVVAIRWIPRYDQSERVLHWVHTATFFVLALTGMTLFFPWLRPFAQGESGMICRLVHRIAGVIFAAVPIAYAVFKPRRLVATLKDLRVSSRDFGWLKAVPFYYLLGRHGVMPPQGRFNAGEKMNIIVLASSTVLFTISGCVMWFGKGTVPAGLFNAMVILHVITMAAALTMFLVHFYLATVHPLMWQSLVGMRFGVVSESFAREHHAAWYYGEEKAMEMYEKARAEAEEATVHTEPGKL